MFFFPKNSNSIWITSHKFIGNCQENSNVFEVQLVAKNSTLGQIWTNPAIGLNFLITFLTQRLGLSIFDPKLG